MSKLWQKPKLKLTLHTVLTVVLIIALSISVYAWFFFPMTQYTKVYTDGVINATVKASVYNYKNNSFVPIAVDEEDEIITLQYRAQDNVNEVVVPYFFLWGGEYMTNDLDKTLYKIEISYDNKMGAYPTKLRLYGDFDFTSYCVGRDTNIDINFMKFLYFIPTNGNTNFQNEANFAPMSTDVQAMDLGLIDTRTIGDNLTTFDYKITIYFLIQTDALALQADESLIHDEYGVLDTVFNTAIKFYFRTEPVNSAP